MFVVLINPRDQHEVLVNTSHISLIRVVYAAPPPSGKGVHWITDLEHARKDPSVVRLYEFTVGGVTYRLPAKPGDPVVQVFEEIYKGAIKSESPVQRDEGGQ